MFSIVDMDQDEFMVAMMFKLDQGLIGFNLTPEQQRQFGLTFIDCGENPDFGCSQMSFYGYPSVINSVLPYLFVIGETGFQGSARMIVSFFKPAPNGITDANALDTITSTAPDYQISMYLTFGTPTSAPTVAAYSDFATAVWVTIGAGIACLALAVSGFFMCAVKYSPVAYGIVKPILVDVLDVVVKDIRKDMNGDMKTM
jgi:hypothetical protein